MIISMTKHEALRWLRVLASRDHALAKLRDEAEVLWAEAKLRRDHLDAKEAAIHEKEGEIKRLSEAARRLEHALLGASAEAENLRESARLLTAQLHSADQARASAIAAAEERGHQLVAIKTSLESQIAALRDALSNHSDQLKAKDAAILEKEAEIERLSHSARLLDQAHLGAAVEANNLKESARLLTAQLHSADQARASAIVAAEECGHQLVSIKASLESQIAVLRDALLDHSDQLKAKDTVIFEKEGEIKRLSEVLSRMHEEFLASNREANLMRDIAEARGLEIVAIKESLEKECARKDEEIRLLTAACIEREQLLQQGANRPDSSP
jgi:predicted ribosome quality control (RQC) complex YloA/Tae2 family protein